MNVHLPVSFPEPEPMTRERLEELWRRRLTGWGAGKVLAILLADADAYAAHMIEDYARSDDRWEPR
jgi:hypothetical protein